MDSLAVMTTAPPPWPLAPVSAEADGPGFASLVEQNHGSAIVAPAPPPVVPVQPLSAPPPMPVEVAPGPALAAASPLPGQPGLPPAAAGAGARMFVLPAREAPDTAPSLDAAPAALAPSGPLGAAVLDPPDLRGPSAPAPEAGRPPALASFAATEAPSDSPEVATAASEAAEPARPQHGLSGPVARQQQQVPLAAGPPHAGADAPPMPAMPPLEVASAEVAVAPRLPSPEVGHSRASPASSAEEDGAPDMALALEPLPAGGAQLGLVGAAPPREAGTPAVALAPAERGGSALTATAPTLPAAVVAWPTASAAPDEAGPEQAPPPPGTEASPPEAPVPSTVTVPPANAEAPRVVSPQREAALASSVADSLALYSLSPTSGDAGEVAAPRAEGPSPPPPPPPARQVAPVAIALAFAPGQFSIALDPPQLGRVEIAVQREGDGHQVRVLAERPETLALLERDRGELDRALAEAGVPLGEGALSFALAGDAGGSGDARGGREGEAGRFPRQLPAGPLPAPGPSPQSAPARGLLDLRI